ncbi:DNA replication initiation factor Cdc45 [Pyrenophora tritici-repentis Pt-1C-BFP]|uniref:DNA replication initiation factor Cdc45 n=1 Tax=Pyrenophora tritici-repentis (strain Pt-1C-BFP) TaxID=426418 RepID=B2VYL0_PYRTR|nr:DNA replication initiation factor Cdc45 [Pyrenophora tritici-repentis Pt-1C-BFP]EDU45023.1 DNA replication initiation factor Cdc45 [Pyrenophora tritici-repentis Pt-1C-BFP]
MYLPRNLIAHLYQNLIKRTHAAAPPVLLLVALEPDALCACRILTALLKRDYIPHKIQPIAGYGDLSRAAEELVRPMRTTDGGSGGVVICLGVGGMVDMEEILGLDVDENGEGGTGDVEVWLLDARRPWNLTNVFAAPISHDPATGEFVRRQAGVDKGKILQSYQSSRGGIIVFDDGDIEDELQAEREAYAGLEEMPEVGEEDDMSEDDDDDQEEQPPSGQAPKKRKSWGEEDDSDHDMTDDERPAQRRRSNSLIKKRNKYAHTLDKYYELGTSYSDPVSSLVYNLASELGREDNDLLWNAIVGVSSLELYGRTGSGVGLNPLSAQGGSAGWNGNRGENIRSVLRDERFTHMDMELKRGLRERLIKFAPQYGLDGLVPPKSSTGDPKDGWGFVRCWGWKACLSAIDAGVILGAILEVGDAKSLNQSSFDSSNFVGNSENNEIATTTQEQQDLAQEHITSRFWTAYDALGNIDMLVNHISTAQHLYRAILRTGTALIEKKQIRHLRAFRMAVVKEGPDVQLFTHPGALTKLALWIAEAIVELNGTKDSSDNDSSDEEEEDEHRGAGRNRFGNAFQEVVRETGARVRMDSFEACVIEIKKEDLSGFLEKLSQKAVVG